jgi:hypothetical protein
MPAIRVGYAGWRSERLCQAAPYVATLRVRFGRALPICRKHIRIISQREPPIIVVQFLLHGRFAENALVDQVSGEGLGRLQL